MATTSTTKKILTIDDEQSIVDLIVDILRTNNYQAISATKWTEAVDALNHESPDLVLLDLKMPTIHGTSMLDFIVNEGFNIPVIVVSGFVTDTVAAELKNLGVSGIVRKPFKARELLAAIEQQLGPNTPVTQESSPNALLYNREKNGQESPQSISALDALYGKTSNPAPNQNKQPLPEKDILKALERNAPPNTEQPQPAKKKAQTPPPELLEALQKNASPTEEAPQEKNKKRTQPPPVDNPIDNPITNSPLANPQNAPAFDRRESSSRPRRARRKMNKGNMAFMGAITVVCVLVAGFLAVMQWLASEAPTAMEEFKTKAENWGQQQMNDQMDKMKQQMQQQEIRKKIEEAKK